MEYNLLFFLFFFGDMWNYLCCNYHSNTDVEIWRSDFPWCKFNPFTGTEETGNVPILMWKQERRLTFSPRVDPPPAPENITGKIDQTSNLTGDWHTEYVAFFFLFMLTSICAFITHHSLYSPPPPPDPPQWGPAPPCERWSPTSSHHPVHCEQ